MSTTEAPASAGVSSQADQQRPLDQLELAEPAAQSEAEYPTGLKFRAIVAALACAMVLAGLDLSIVATAIPSITNHFKTVADIGWYVSAYRLTSCSFQFLFGKLYALYSVKLVFMVALAIFEAGSLLCTIAPTSTALVIGRAITGLGGAGIFSGCFTIIAQTVPLRKRSIYGSGFAAAETIASVAAPLLGGFLADRLSWRACFAINLPLGATTFLIIWYFFENPRANETQSLSMKEKVSRLDITGAMLFVPAIICLLLALQWGGTKFHWDSSRIISLFVLSMMLLAGFAFWQRKRGDEAMVPPRILVQRSMLAGACFALLNNAAVTVVESYVIIYLQGVKGLSAAKSGIVTMPTIIGLLVGCLIAGYGTSIVGFYTPFMIVTSIIGPVAAGLLTTLRIQSKLIALLCYEALLGFAVGIGIQAPQVAASAIFSSKDAPLGTAVVQFGSGIGPAIFITVAQSIFTGRLTADLGHYASGLNATSIENMGLSDLRSHIGPKKLENVLLGYDKAVVQTLYLPVTLTTLSIIAALAMEWRSVKEKTQ